MKVINKENRTLKHDSQSFASGTFLQHLEVKSLRIRLIAFYCSFMCLALLSYPGQHDTMSVVNS